MEKLNIEYIPLSEIKPYSNNPRKNKKAVDIVKNSIKQFGFKNPIILDKNNEIIAGHTRLEASKQLDYKEIPVIWADDLTDKQVKAFRIMDNKSQEYAEWDENLLKQEMNILKENNFDLDLTGFGKQERAKKLDEIQEDKFDAEKAYQEPKHEIKEGEIYRLGDHILICGDSKKKETFKSLLKEREINCVFTSPPYNMAGNMYKNYKDNLQKNEYIKLNLEVLDNIKEHLNGYIFWNMSYNKNTRESFLDVMKGIKDRFNFLELIVWNKKTAMPINSKKMLTRTYENIVFADNKEAEDIEWYWLGNTGKNVIFNKKTSKTLNNYWEISALNSQTELNKACFPIKLPAKGILLTTNEGENVLDPFAGSGSTLIACEQSKRNCFLIEYDPALCSVIIERWEKYTGKKHKKIR